jgi:hypothetical protein
MVDSVTLGSLRRLTRPVFQNIGLAASKSGNLSLFYESVSDSLTANAGGGQTNALALTSEVNRITTVATAGDSVMLPSTATIGSSNNSAYEQLSGQGMTVLLINHGANAMQVFGNGTDTIDDLATATGVSQMAGSMVLYTCTSAGKWYSEGLATGFSLSTSLQTFSYTNTLSYATATAQSLAKSTNIMSAMMNRLPVGAGISDSVSAIYLPSSSAGMSLTFLNGGSLSVNLGLSSTADLLNAAATYTAILAVASGKSVEAFCCNTGQWHTLLSA